MRFGRWNGRGRLYLGMMKEQRSAFKIGLVDDGDVWMEMIQSRNRTSHTYNQDLANQIVDRIIAAYYPAFQMFSQKMETLRE